MFTQPPFQPVSMGFPFGAPPSNVPMYHSHFARLNTQAPPSSRGQSLPAPIRHYIPASVPYASGPPSPRRAGPQLPPPGPSQHRRSARSKNKKPQKRKNASPNGVADQSLYSDKENDEKTETLPDQKSFEQQPESTFVDQPPPEADASQKEPQQVESASGELLQKGPIDTSEAPPTEKKKKHHHHHHHPNQPPPTVHPAAAQANVHRTDRKRPVRLPFRENQPHYSQQPPLRYPLNNVRPPPYTTYRLFPTQAGLYGPRPAPPTGRVHPHRPWPNTFGVKGPAEQEIQRLRNYIHSLENELHKLRKKVRKASVHRDETLPKDEHDRQPSTRQTPVIVELNNTTNESLLLDAPSKKKHRHRTSTGTSSQPGPTSTSDTLASQKNNNNSSDMGQESISIAPQPPVTVAAPDDHNYNQSNNNELADRHDDRRRQQQEEESRSAERILDAFERFYLNRAGLNKTPMKVKFIPEEHSQRTASAKHGPRAVSRSESCSPSSSSWSSPNRSSARRVTQKTSIGSAHLLTR